MCYSIVLEVEELNNRVVQDLKGNYVTFNCCIFSKKIPIVLKKDVIFNSRSTANYFQLERYNALQPRNLDFP